MRILAGLRRRSGRRSGWKRNRSAGARGRDAADGGDADTGGDDAGCDHDTSRDHGSDDDGRYVLR